MVSAGYHLMQNQSNQIQGSFIEKEKEELSYGRYIPR